MTAVLMDNEAVILELFPKGDYLVFCGSIHQGLCSVYPMADLGNEHRLDATNVTNLGLRGPKRWRGIRIHF